jgi:hypothetical protein
MNWQAARFPGFNRLPERLPKQIAIRQRLEFSWQRD